MNKFGACFLVIFSGLIFSCGDDILPKPNAMLRLSYPTPTYEKSSLDCSYTFEKNNIARFKKAKNSKNCWYNISYPKLKATIYVSYYGVRGNLDSLLRDAQNLTQEHFIKADAIQPKDFVYPEKKVFGRIYEVTGNAASSCQFYVTDSTDHLFFRQQNTYEMILFILWKRFNGKNKAKRSLIFISIHRYLLIFDDFCSL